MFRVELYNVNLMGIGPVSDTVNNKGHHKMLSEPLLMLPNLPMITCICTASGSKENTTPTWDLPVAVTVRKSYLLNCFQNTDRRSTLAASGW